LWRDEGSNLTWLAQVPLIQLERSGTPRKPYPIDWSEQRLLFQELPSHLQEMALFDVNTGLRSAELCGLQWDWEQRVPELDTPEIKPTVFVLPGSVTKNGEPRVVVLNDTAQAVIETVRGQHPVYVFSWWDRRVRKRVRTAKMGTRAGEKQGAGQRLVTKRNCVARCQPDSAEFGCTIFGTPSVAVFARRA
jgi:integrase